MLGCKLCRANWPLCKQASLLSTTLIECCCCVCFVLVHVVVRPVLCVFLAVLCCPALMCAASESFVFCSSSSARRCIDERPSVMGVLGCRHHHLRAAALIHECVRVGGLYRPCHRAATPPCTLLMACCVMLLRDGGFFTPMLTQTLVSVWVLPLASNHNP